MKDISITNLMSTTVATTSQSTDLKVVIRSMLEQRFSCMVVVEEGAPVGIVTERDFIRLLAEKNDSAINDRKVSDVMSCPVITVIEGTNIYNALFTMTTNNIRHLPVVDTEGKLTGLITLGNLAKYQFQVLEQQREEIEYTITVRTKQLLEANEKLKVLSMVDSLMEIGNRRAMEVDLESTHAQAVRYSRDYSAALFDLDFFKRYNDHYGHLNGDTALRKVAEYLKSRIRKSDRLYRYGGEEILLLLPETPLDGAEVLVGRILEEFASLSIPHQMSPFRVLTMSCGLACQSSTGSRRKGWKDIVTIADRGLYQAKQSGRNKYVAIEMRRNIKPVRAQSVAQEAHSPSPALVWLSRDNDASIKSC